MPLPAPWQSYKTQDGKEYYYNPQTKVTTWTRPSGSSSSKTPPKHEHHKSGGAASSPAAMEGAGRGGLLAQIQQGASLKKVKTVEKTLFAGHPSGEVGGGASAGVSASASAPAPAAGGMGAMMAAIKSGGNLKKTPSNSGIQRENSAGAGASSASNGTGGFAEIMRKNREAAARRAGGSAPSAHNSAPSTPRHTIPTPTPASNSNSNSNSGGYENGNAGSGSVEARLAAIEIKLDKIMAHLGIN